MISEIRIQNFKSIHDLTLKPGRVTVLIGENGSGKSNILEAIAFAAGAAANKLDNEFLFNRGIRVTENAWMRAAFPEEPEKKQKREARSIRLRVKGTDREPVFECRVKALLRPEDHSFARWRVSAPVLRTELDSALLEEDFAQEVEQAVESIKAQRDERSKVDGISDQLFKRVIAQMRLARRKERSLRGDAKTLGLAGFMIYAPENTVLRTPPPESAVQPLGTKGEGLLTLLEAFSDPKVSDRLEDMKERLHLFGWFEDFLAPDETATAQARLQIRDRWLAPEHAVFDQRSANEGFLYLLFYFTLLMSWRTPTFFALDNVDNALNPKLCSALMRQIVELAKKYGKQVICTTHNPALLDGLNINDDDQRLYTVQRDTDGHTVVNRVQPPKPQPGKPPMKLSAAFLAGHIGGLPDHF